MATKDSVEKKEIGNVTTKEAVKRRTKSYTACVIQIFPFGGACERLRKTINFAKCKCFYGYAIHVTTVLGTLHVTKYWVRYTCHYCTGYPIHVTAVYCTGYAIPRPSL